MLLRQAFPAILLGLLAPAAFSAPLSYNRDIRPILSDNCFHCHGPDKKSRDSGLRLDIREEALKPAKSGDIAIVPGKPDESQMIVRIFSDDKEEVMPPPKAHKELSASQKDLLKRWIAEGAKYEAHWAYTPLVRPNVPEVADRSAVRKPMDAFIQQRLAELQIKPSPQADRRTLIRRLYLDLVGLPPAPEEVASFEQDSRPDAYEQLVDRLLASPRYGERMAQQWLDLARYADTVGFHGDQNQNVWAYRDWVINAFNQNMRFDQFTIEQLAGDLLPNPTPAQLTATCFNRLTMMTREGGAQPKEYLAKYTADRIRTVGTTWLGSTMGCCECHDHKFDPFTQKDFYSLGAFFADVKQWGVYGDYSYTPNPDLRGFTNDYPFPPEITVESDALKRRIQNYRGSIADLLKSTPAPAEAMAEWKSAITAFLAANPSGWITPKAKATLTPSTKEVTEEKGGAVSLEPLPTRDILLEVPVTTKWIGAIRLELLPGSKAGNKLFRSAKGEVVKPAISVLRKGKVINVAMRQGQADQFAPQYANGYAAVGIEGGWKIDPEQFGKPATALYQPSRPMVMESGDVLRVTFPESTLTSVRLSYSPLAPLSPEATTLPKDLAAQIANEANAPEWFLRSTGYDRELFEKVAQIDRAILDCRGGKTPVLVTERLKNPLTVRVLHRGNWQDETGEVCDPSTPHFLPPLPDAQGRSLTRLDLAKWLVSAQNPLTARVVMNRLWRQFFGNALSAQVDDLGAQGEPPSHPELLDWLASEFRDSGWDLKHMVREIVTSHTYQQVAGIRAEMKERDPQNRLLASQNPRRLEAEFVRDNALAIAGLLNLEEGGPAAKPYQPAEYYADIQFPSRKYEPDRDERQWRRGVYMWWQRTFLHPMLLNFDAPSREDCIALRSNANTPQQALTLLNDPTFVEAGRVWAERLLTNATDDTQRIQLAYRQALSREPRPEELSSLLKALAQAREEYRKLPEDGPKLLSVGISPKSATQPPDEIAAWTTVCRVILNLHETITRY